MLTKKISRFSGIPNAAFFFSAIATHERKKEPDENDTAEDMRSQVRSQVDRLVGGNVENTDKVLHPAISYWITLTTPNGTPANPITVHRALLDCGVAVTSSQVRKLFVWINRPFLGYLSTYPK